MRQTPEDELPDHLYLALYKEGMLESQGEPVKKSITCVKPLHPPVLPLLDCARGVEPPLSRFPYTRQINNCAECRAGMPTVDGYHMNGDISHMRCTNDLYN